MAYKQISPLSVPEGGSGAISLTGVVTGNGTSALTANTVTQHGVLVGGASNAVASTAVGTAGQVLTSNGAGVDPTYQNNASTSGSYILLETQTASASATIDFTGLASYTSYFVKFANVLPANNNQQLLMRYSDDDGSTFETTAYQCGLFDNDFNSATVTNATSAIFILLQKT